MIWDTIVVGAGPGGCSVAYHLAKEGHKVLLLDKSTFPRDKVCGDAIAPRALRLLQKMKFEPCLKSFQKVSGVKLFGSKGRSLELNFSITGDGYPHYGYIVSRKKFDQLLCEHTIRAGVEFWPDSLVTEPIFRNGVVCGVKACHSGRDVEIEGKTVVGADGARSTLGRRLGLLKSEPRYIAVATRLRYTGVVGLSDFMEIYLDDYLLPSYGWVFPEGENRANVGVGILNRDVVKLREGKLRDLLSRFIESECLKEKLASAKPMAGPKAAPLRLGLGASKVAGSGVLLVGDAASLGNPFTGEGITYALESGLLAAYVVGKRLGGVLTPEQGAYQYRQLLQQAYSRYFKMATQVVEMFKKPFLAPICFDLTNFFHLSGVVCRLLSNTGSLLESRVSRKMLKEDLI